MRQHLFDSRMHTRNISEPSLSNQHSRKLTINAMIVPSEPFFRSCDRSRKRALQIMLLQQLPHRLLEYSPKHLTQYSTNRIGQNLRNHSSSLSNSYPQLKHAHPELIVSYMSIQTMQ